MKVAAVGLALVGSGGVLGLIGSWGIAATAAWVWVGIYGALVLCGIATMLLGVGVWTRDLVKVERLDRGAPDTQSGSSPR